MTSGIQDVYPLPAVGVLNIRPNGPCFNTHVDIEQVREEIKKFLIDDDAAKKEKNVPEDEGDGQK